MQLSNYSFDQLSFTKLFKTYVTEFGDLENFYPVNPFDDEAIAEKADQLSFKGDRSRTAAILADFNKQFDVDQAAIDNLHRLEEEDAVAVVTGQQLGIYGGPLYTILKTLSVIHLAKKLEKNLDRPVIPVFWLADEDHDYEEVRSIQVPENDEIREFALSPKTDHLPPVARLPIPEEITNVRQELKSVLYDTDFSDDLWDLLDTSFKTGNTFLQAFGQFMSTLFSKHGLVLAGSNYPRVKEATSDVLKQSIAKADQIRQQLEQQSKGISESFHQQVKLYDSNLFYLDEKEGRTKIVRNGEEWKTDTGLEWETEELLAGIGETPSKFSPNVFLRPLLQDALLPTLGYVAGPGETAYYGQMKSMYSSFELEMPVIFPRLSATFIEPSIDRIIDELPFEFHEYGKRIEDLESEYVDRTEQHDIEAIFNEWKEKVEEVAETKKKQIAEIDPTLEGAAANATSTYYNELDKLKGKVYRAVKKQDETQLKRIRRIKGSLFPGDELQERVIGAIFFMNKYGIDLWDELLDSLDKDEQFDHHKLIYL